MTSIKTLIIDDDVNSSEILISKLRRYDNINIVGTATSGKKGMEMIAQLSPELVFLDVELPDINGILFLEQIDESVFEECRFVMYTGHPQYMLKCFRGNAFDFLQKPIDETELHTIIERMQSMDTKDVSSSGPAIVKQKQEDKLLLYLNTVDFRLVDIKEIGAFCYNHELRVWEVIWGDGHETIRLKRNVTNESILVIDPRFVQVSQRHIINKNFLMEVRDNICHLYPPFDKINNIKVGRLFRKKLIDQFNTI